MPRPAILMCAAPPLSTDVGKSVGAAVGAVGGGVGVEVGADVGAVGAIVGDGEQNPHEYRHRFSMAGTNAALVQKPFSSQPRHSGDVSVQLAPRSTKFCPSVHGASQAVTTMPTVATKVPLFAAAARSVRAKGAALDGAGERSDETGCPRMVTAAATSPPAPWQMAAGLILRAWCSACPRSESMVARGGTFDVHATRHRPPCPAWFTARTDRPQSWAQLLLVLSREWPIVCQIGCGVRE